MVKMSLLMMRVKKPETNLSDEQNSPQINGIESNRIFAPLRINQSASIESSPEIESDSIESKESAITPESIESNMSNQMNPLNLFEFKSDHNRYTPGEKQINQQRMELDKDCNKGVSDMISQMFLSQIL